MLMTRETMAPFHILTGRAADTDLVADAAGSDFVRGLWADAAAPGAVRHVVALRGDGSPLAAFPLTSRRIGPVAIGEIAGCYWPFRSVALTADQSEAAALLRDPEMRTTLGRAWRLGPVFSDDAAVDRLRAAARAVGWSVLERRLGTCFEIDVAGLLLKGAWPRASTLKKNRWREKQLGEDGAVEIVRFSGADWSPEHRDAIAAIERGSWLGQDATAALQFADPKQRAYWEAVARDPVIAAMIFGSVMTVGGVPAAFSFGLETGGVRYQIANNYDERFAQHSAGRTLLIRDFEDAAARGIAKISWGSGDAGYKSQMDAQAGPEILDLLFIRSKILAAALRPLWRDAAD